MQEILIFSRILGAVVVLWSIPWKIYAVWLAVKHNRKGWFVVLVLLNTLSILEMIYIFKVEKKTWSEVEEAFRRGWRMLKHTKKEDFKS